MNEIEPAELADRRAEEETDSGLRIVDVRSPASFRRGHIPGSENVPLNQLPDRAAEFDGADTVVTVCPHGEASLQAARILGAYEGLQDAELYSLAGGLTAWDGNLESPADEPAKGSSENRSEAPF